jgi:hypothetical protein
MSKHDVEVEWGRRGSRLNKGKKAARTLDGSVAAISAEMSNVAAK